MVQTRALLQCWAPADIRKVVAHIICSSMHLLCSTIPQSEGIAADIMTAALRHSLCTGQL